MNHSGNNSGGAQAWYGNPYFIGQTRVGHEIINNNNYGGLDTLTADDAQTYNTCVETLTNALQTNQASNLAAKVLEW